MTRVPAQAFREKASKDMTEGINLDEHGTRALTSRRKFLAGSVAHPRNSVLFG